MLGRFPQPPVDTLVMPAGPQRVITIILGVLVTGLVVAALRDWRRSHSPVYLLLIIGGTLAAANEPIVDVLGLCFHPAIAGWTAFETYGRPIPAWAVLAYPMFFGGLSCLVIMFLRHGATRKNFWLGVTAIFIVDLVLELPLLNADVYVYYGYQPFKVLGLFPIHWLLINGLGVLLIAAPVVKWPRFFRGPRSLFLLILPPLGQFAAAAIAIPVFSLLNTHAPEIFLWVADAATMALGLCCFNAVATAICIPADQKAPVTSSARRISDSAMAVSTQ
jgi:hypothetical protein